MSFKINLMKNISEHEKTISGFTYVPWVAALYHAGSPEIRVRLFDGKPLFKQHYDSIGPFLKGKAEGIEVAPSEPREAEAKPLQPLVKWAGGKRWLVPHLEPLWARHRERRLVEPFCGGMAVALGLRPRRALLNDINPHLINLYRWVQQGLEITLPMENDPTTYYAYRRRFNELIASGASHTEEAAEIFYYLNRTGYNGLCRFNRKGEFNVPFGRYKQIRYKRRFPEYQEAFAGWTFTSLDFEEAPLELGDFVYADPPLRRGVYPVRPRGLHLGRPGAPGPLAGKAQRSRGGIQPGHGAHRAALRGTWLPPPLHSRTP